MIVDSHTHIEHYGPWDRPPELIIRQMDEAGVARAVVMTFRDAPRGDERILEYVAESVARYPDRLIGYARLNPMQGDKAMQALEKAIGEYGFKGLKLHPVSTLAHPAGEATLALMRRAAELGAPVLFHCGDEELTLPLQIARAACQVPEATVILGHMGGYFHGRDALAVARKYPNILLDTSAMPYPALVKAAVAAIGAQRVLYASDGPGPLMAIEVQKVKLAGLSPEQEELVFHGNIERLLAGVKKGGRA